MFNLDTATGQITIPQGDTAEFVVNIIADGRLPKGTVAVFGVRNASTSNKYLLTKAFDVQDDNSVHVRLTNHDTRELPIASHKWDIRIVTDPNRDPETNEVIAPDDGDNVYSAYSGTRDMPPFVVTDIAARI